MKNKLIDVHNILMATLEDLDDEELMNDPERMKKVIELARVKSQVANTIVDVGTLGLNAMKQQEENGIELVNTLRISDK